MYLFVLYFQDDFSFNLKLYLSAFDEERGSWIKIHIPNNADYFNQLPDGRPAMILEKITELCAQQVGTKKVYIYGSTKLDRHKSLEM